MLIMEDQLQALNLGWCSKPAGAHARMLPDAAHRPARKPGTLPLALIREGETGGIANDP